MVYFYDRFLDFLAWIAALLILAIMVGVGLDVASRLFLGRSIGWMFEFVQHSLMSVLFLGSAWLTRQNGHVAIDILVQGLPENPSRFVHMFGFGLSALTAGFIAYWAGVVAIDNFSRGILTTGIYPIPRHILLSIIAFGMLFTAIEFLRLVVRSYNGTLQHETPPVSPA